MKRQNRQILFQDSEWNEQKTNEPGMAPILISQSLSGATSADSMRKMYHPGGDISVMHSE